MDLGTVISEVEDKLGRQENAIDEAAAARAWAEGAAFRPKEAIAYALDGERAAQAAEAAEARA